MYTLKIWYRFKHDDYTVAEVYHQPEPQKQVQDLVREGGFWAGSYFVPYHCISTIESIEEPQVEGGGK
jgi:hypothetical protein